MSTDSPKFKYNHQVLLSFNEGDSRKSFVDPLCTALVEAGLRPFIYFDEISSGSQLDLKQAIEESKIRIVVLSQNYMSTSGITGELVAIVEWSKIIDNGGVVLPVFYGVNPSKVGQPSIEYALHSAKFTVNELDEWRVNELDEWWKGRRSWRDALTEVGNMTGIVLQNGEDSDVPKIIEGIVGFISEGLKTKKISSWGNKVCDLMDSGLSKLPNDMVFPALEKLFLQDNKYLLTIPPSFFNFMPSLQVLDMSRTSIKKLPTSISNLVKLQKLFMRDCKLLMELPSEIQDLSNLEIFDLSGTELIYIPKEIEKLLKLEILKMSLCTSSDEYVLEINKSKKENDIEIFPKRTLSKLSSGSMNNLQILALSACPNLDTIFDAELLCNLLKLKELIVEDCAKVESLVIAGCSNLEYGKEYLPCLEKITLLFLPELVSISRGLRIAPRLVRMVVYDCPKLQTLSPMEVCSKNIKEIKGESEWWEAVERSSDQLDVFVPIGGDDLMNQLADARTSGDALRMIQVNENEDQISNSGETDDIPEGFSREFSIDEVLAATQDFSDSLVIGHGVFGKVYKGEIDHGTRTVAIKKSWSMSPMLRKGFHDEVLMVSRFRHSHLASFLGYCETDNEMILVYEYMDGGTLYENLHGKHRIPLRWVERLKIIICVANALAYLHADTNKVIYHDLKSSNILLDQDRTIAKLSNFGLSKIHPANQEDTSVIHGVVGTLGYIDLEFHETDNLTRQSDVYAFGVILFELLCGKQAVDVTLDEDQRGLAGWAQSYVEKGKVAEIIDPNLKSEMIPHSLSAFVNIAYKCLNTRLKEQPTMTEVLAALELALSLQEFLPVSGASEIDTEVTQIDDNAEAGISYDISSTTRNSYSNQELVVQQSREAPPIDDQQSRDAAHAPQRNTIRSFTDHKPSSFQENIAHSQPFLLPCSSAPIMNFGMVESFAFQAAGKILGKLTTLAIHEIRLFSGVKSDLKKLEHTVSSIKSVLLDAGEQKKTSQRVSVWLEKLHDSLEDAGDMLDDVMTEELRHKVKGSKRKAITNFFSSSNPLILSIEMNRRIQRIRSNLEEINANANLFQFAKRDVDSVVTYWQIREQANSFVPASEIIGRDNDKERIIKLLLNTPSSLGSSMAIVEDIHVLLIVGQGGLGKTTLAKIVYNDDAISSHFDFKLWICVSEEYDVKKLIEKIMEDATGGVDHSHLELNELQVRLRTTLKSKKFLLVIDDVCTEDLVIWIKLKELLRCSSHGSKVVVTTRNRTIAKTMGTFAMYELETLSNEECMSIFVRCAFKEGEDEHYRNLIDIGKEVVMKCNGLPLAVKILGGLLSTEREEHEWVRIRDTCMREIPKDRYNFLDILELSYGEMPRQLKQCFVQCAIFPRGSNLSKVNIVSHWMAHGLLNSQVWSRVSENRGDQYLHELISRSFFQDVLQYYDGTIKNFKMHDMEHDLVLYVAGNTISHITFDSTLGISDKTRHLIICEQGLEGKEFPHKDLQLLKKLRSLRFQFAPRSISKKFLDTLIKTFNYLRVLDLAGSDFEELPSSIGGLYYLRFLDLHGNVNIKRLSDHICQLINLQTLNLMGCIMLQDLPRHFGDLWSLRVLSLTCRMKLFPTKGVAEGLSSLQELSFSYCVDLENLLGGTRYFTALRILRIHECPNLETLPAQSMEYLTSLEVLSISNCEKLNMSDEGSKTVKLPRGLWSLSLRHLPKLKELPSGFQGASVSLKCIEILNCYSFQILPVWFKKCTSLSKLRLEGCAENMKENCQARSGKYFPLISHISEVRFD